MDGATEAAVGATWKNDRMMGDAIGFNSAAVGLTGAEVAAAGAEVGAYGVEVVSQVLMLEPWVL